MAHDLSVTIYQITNTGAFSRDYPLRNQIWRAAISVMSNIAEGFERHSRAEFRQFLSIARGSAAEVRCQLHLARALGYLSEADADELSAFALRISRMLGSLWAKVRVR